MPRSSVYARTILTYTDFHGTEPKLREIIRVRITSRNWREFVNRRLQYLLVILLALGVAADSGLASLGAQRGRRVLGLVDRSTPHLRARLHPGRVRPAAVLVRDRRRPP